MDAYPINGFDASTPWLAPLTPFVLSVGRAALGVEALNANGTTAC